jgi:hypothetical protein
MLREIAVVAVVKVRVVQSCDGLGRNVVVPIEVYRRISLAKFCLVEEYVGLARIPLEIVGM